MTSAVAKLAGLLVPLLLCSQTRGGLHRMDQLGSAHLEARSADLRESAGRLALVNVTLGQMAQFARPVEEAGQLRLSLDPIPGITAKVYDFGSIRIFFQSYNNCTNFTVCTNTAFV